MVLNPLSVTVTLQALRCIEKGIDSGGLLNTKREPYLWALFFKLDGATVTLDSSLTLTGSATTHAARGSHGSLGGIKVDEGDAVPIPPSVGRWQTSLSAIALPDALPGMPGVPETPDVPGDENGDGLPDLPTIPGTGGLPLPRVPLSARRGAMTTTRPATPRLGVPFPVPAAVGVIFALLEHDWTSEELAEAAHRAFNDALTQELTRLIAEISSQQLQVNNPRPSEEQQRVIARRVEQAVVTAARNRVGAFQAVANLVNKDDFIGADGVVFSQLDLLPTAVPTVTKPFSKRFTTTNNTGTWEISGQADAAVLAGTRAATPATRR